MKEAKSGVVYFLAAAFLGYMWITGKGQRALTALTGAIDRQGSRPSGSASAIATPAGSVGSPTSGWT